MIPGTAALVVPTPLGIYKLAYLGEANTVSTASLALPEGHQEGDFAIMITRGSSTSPSTPSGWSSQGSHTDSGTTMAVFARILQSDEETVEDGLSGTPGSHCRQVLVYRANKKLSGFTRRQFLASHTNNNPGQQTMNWGGETDAALVVGAIVSGSAAPTWTVNTFPEGAGPDIVVGTSSTYRQRLLSYGYKRGEERSNVSIDMADQGSANGTLLTWFTFE